MSQIDFGLIVVVNIIVIVIIVVIRCRYADLVQVYQGVGDLKAVPDLSTVPLERGSVKSSQHYDGFRCNELTLLPGLSLVISHCRVAKLRMLSSSISVGGSFVSPSSPLLRSSAFDFSISFIRRMLSLNISRACFFLSAG